MRFTAPLAAAALAISGVVANPSLITPRGLNYELNAANHYGAPLAPWEEGCEPGWYYGHDNNLFDDLVCLTDGLVCLILDLLPLDCLHCPHLLPPPPNPPPVDCNGYTQTFSGLTGAIQAPDGTNYYQTYGLVDTVTECESMCNAVAGCNFVNTYHDVNGKGGSTQLTCSLFTECLGTQYADNRGGQTEPNGSIDYITDSAGYCKDSA